MITASALDQEKVAHQIAQVTSDMLCASVELGDDAGNVLARSMPGGRAPGATEAPLDEAWINVPVRLNGQAVRVRIGEPADGEAISPRLARIIIETAIDQSAMASQLPAQHEMKNKFIFELLRGQRADYEDIHREGEILGMDFSRPRAVVLIDAADYILISSPPEPDARMRRRTLRAQHVIASVVSYFRLPSDAICAYIGDGEVAVLKASSVQDLALWSSTAGDGDGAPWNVENPSWADLAALKRACSGLLQRLRRDTATAINIGVGRYHPGIAGLARSYQDASAALSLGKRVHGENRVHCLDQLGAAAFMGLSDARTKSELAAHLLSPLDHEPELRETIDALFAENCSLSTTASRLCIHRNTLTYRLDKIASLTGLDPRRFDDAVQIRLATVLRTI